MSHGFFIRLKVVQHVNNKARSDVNPRPKNINKKAKF